MDKTTYKKEKVQTNHATIDSMVILLKIERCKILDDKLISKTRTFYEDTNEISELQPAKPIMLESKCKSIRITIGLKHVAGQTYVQLKVTSKLLKERYFEGINKDTISTYFHMLTEEKILEISWEHFLDGLVNDIDICKNIYINDRENFIPMVRDIEKITNESRIIPDVRNKEYHKGIYYRQRGNGTVKLPYWKIYDKERELIMKPTSVDFRKQYLQQYDINHLVRIEATIKNSSDIKELGKKGIIPKVKSLKDIMLLEASELDNYIKYAVNQYMNENYKDKRIMVERDTLSPTQAMIGQAIKVILEDDNYRLDEIKEMLAQAYLATDKNRQAVGRSRNRKMINEILNIMEKNDDEIRQKIAVEKETKNLLKSIGIEIG